MREATTILIMGMITPALVLIGLTVIGFAVAVAVPTFFILAVLEGVYYK